MNRILKIGLLAGLVSSGIAISGCGGAVAGFSPFAFGGLVFYNGGDIFTIQQNGANLRPCTTGVFISSMSFNRKVVTSKTISGIDQIFIMNANGTNQVQLTNAGDDSFRPCITPDGNKIAFISRRDGNEEIYIMNSDGTGQTRLTNDPGSDYFPSISSDGSKIVFTSDRDGNTEVYSINSDGTGLLRLTNNGAEDTTPAWSPDGTKILFTSTRDGNGELYTANANGTGQTRLTTTAEDEYHASYNLDGDRIFYYDATTDNVRRINADGSNRVNITTGGGVKNSGWVY